MRKASPMIRSALVMLLLSHLALSAAESPATGIAAKVIRERALDLEHRGQRPVAEQLRVLADGLAGGTVSLSDAALVVQIALAGAPAATATPMQSPEQHRAAIASAATATLVLDGETPTTATAAKEPAIDEKALGVPVATTVLIASYVGDPKSLLVMIGAGKDQQIKTSQRFAVKRGDTKIAVISSTQVKDNSTICIAIPGTLADGAEIKPGDSVVPE